MWFELRQHTFYMIEMSELKNLNCRYQFFYMQILTGLLHLVVTGKHQCKQKFPFEQFRFVFISSHMPPQSVMIFFPSVLVLKEKSVLLTVTHALLGSFM